MSRLKELRLHGFKSFADPTLFVFEPGVNAVIGPNGSGKSNMADAVRWVLGEQSNRSLRTRRADEVIFAGSEARRPQGLAEAILTLDNADGWLPIDFSEVTIGRRAYRSGEGEYLINGARARLRDVVELLGAGRLGANELVVVGQGTVDAALSLRPEERRQLFEEAAGVKNLQVRKNEATGRLAGARDNLVRVSDLVGELRPQVRRLALQAEHQQQHQALAHRARALVIDTHRRREHAARAALGEARRAAADAEAALEAFRADQEAGTAAVVEAERRYWAAEEAARSASRDREATREALIRAESRQEALVARCDELDATVARSQEELETTHRGLAALAEGEVDPWLGPTLAAATAAEERWRAAVERLTAADADLLAAEEAVAEERRQQSERIAVEARRGEQHARAAARRDETLQALAAARRRLAAAETSIARARDALQLAERGEGELRAGLEAAAGERDAAQEAADAAREAASRLTERASALRAELAAFEERVRHVGRLGADLAAAGWSPILEALDAPAEAWPAIEAVVGGELEQALLWRDGDVVRWLQGARGTARFLASGGATDAERQAAMAAVGAQRTLAEWVGGSPPAALHHAVVAADVEALVAGWRRLPAGWVAVTPAGDLADARGLLALRGRAEPAGGASARDYRRRRELAETVERVEGERDAAGTAAHAALTRLRETRDRHVGLREAHDGVERELRRARAEVDAAEAEHERAAREAISLETELDAVSESASPSVRAAGEAERADALATLEAAARAAGERRADAAREHDVARDAWRAARASAEEAEMRSAGEQHSRAVLEARIGQLEADLPVRRAAAAALREDLRRADELAATARAADARVAAALERAEGERQELRRALLQLERAAGGVTGRLAELERAAQAMAVEASRREDALDTLARERDLALDGLPPAREAAPPEDLAELDDEALEAELRRVRRLLGQVGSVNPFAVDEHRELAERLDGLAGQDRDLRTAIADTEELIARLEAEIGEQFNAAFRAIGERFDEYCRLLFAGGSASLQMADEADGDAPGGIEIVVRPPGKRLQRLSMLSGGERALTGVALLFAMLSVNPVPFCILDEVDAALDEANIGRFADALRRLAESIDFVVITHNRATIEVADTIYGVTMTDAAVSRVLSLRLADLASEVSA